MDNNKDNNKRTRSESPEPIDKREKNRAAAQKYRETRRAEHQRLSDRVAELEVAYAMVLTENELLAVEKEKYVEKEQLFLETMFNLREDHKKLLDQLVRVRFPTSFEATVVSLLTP